MVIAKRRGGLKSKVGGNRLVPTAARPYSERMANGAEMARTVPITVLDFETTGAVRGWPVEPWQLGAVRVRCGRVVAAERRETWLRVAADRPFNPHAPGRHARLRRELAQAPDLASLWPELEPWLTGGALAAHHVGTERSILERVAPLHRLGPWIDTLALTRHAYPRLASAALEDVIAALRLRTRLDELLPGRAPHDALYDAFACALLLEHFLSLPGWENVTVQALSAQQFSL
jgi:DNA polymerase III epsilon subunit-like protein